MKYLTLIVIAAISIASVTSCTKQQQPLTASQIAIAHTWYLKYELLNNIQVTAPCMLSEQLTFKKDSTANQFYSITCDSSQAVNLPFTWYMTYYSPQNYNIGSILYIYNLGGVTDSNLVLRAFILNKDTLALEGSIPGGGPYRAIFTSAN